MVDRGGLRLSAMLLCLGVLVSLLAGILHPAREKWWAAGPGYTTPFAEVDLRVGGRHRLAMKPPDSDVIQIVGGVLTRLMEGKR